MNSEKKLLFIFAKKYSQAHTWHKPLSSANNQLLENQCVMIKILCAEPNV